MNDQKLETEANFSDYSKSESMSGTEDSVSSQPQNNGGLECRKKLKKVRSIRLPRLSSMRSSTRRRKSQYDNLSMLSSVSTESSGRSTPIEVSEASPNYMKATSSSHAKESFQISQTLFIRKTVTRMSTLKLKRSLTRKLPGGTVGKMKLRPSTSIKLATARGLRLTRQMKRQCNANPVDSESICGSENKSQKVITRRLSFKPVRTITKISTSKSKKSSMEEGLQVCQSAGSGLHKATCSSTLKDSHSPDRIDLPQGGSGSQELSTMKSCSYTYCSLHGRHHDNSPPLKHFVTMRRRLLKTRNSMKMEIRPVSRSKHSGNTRNATQKSQTVHSEGPVHKTAHSGRSQFQKGKELARDSNVRHHGTQVSTLTGVGISGEYDGENRNLRYNAKVFLGEACCCIATEKDKSDSKVTEAAGKNDKNIATCKKNDEGAAVDSTPTSVVMSSASDIGILEEATVSKDRNMGQDNEVLQANSPDEELNPTCNTDMSSTITGKDHNHTSMSQLIYKHAVLSNKGKGENKLAFNEQDKQGKGQDALPVNGVNSSWQDYCENETDKHVIELVQKAFDEILLPETEELSAVDLVKSRGIGSDEEVLEKSEGKSGGSNTSTFIESPKEETCLKVDNFRSHEEEITAQKLGAKPDKKSPKSWSNLKKLILLKRFVKALEKVRKFHPRRHGHLPSDASLEAGKVHLRHQTAEEKKNAEEWMLDYALQKVTSKLAPAQKQRVALLVEAFETIVPPFQDTENGMQSLSTVETQARQAKSLDGSSDHTKEEIDKEMDYGYSAKILLEKASFSDNIVTEYADNANHNPTSEERNPIALTERCIRRMEVVDEDWNGKQSLSRSCDNDEKSSIVNDDAYPAEIKDPKLCADFIMSSCHGEAPTNDTINEVRQNLISSLNADISNTKSESPGREFETKNLIGDNEERFSMSKSLILKGILRSLGSNLDSLGAPSDLLDEPTAVRKKRIAEAKLETETLEGVPIHEESETPKSAVVEPETQQEKQNYTGLWYLVYKHMVSSMETNESKPYTDGADESKSVYDGSRTEEASVSNESIPVNEDNGVADTEVELQQIEAIKMVEDAIDAIVPDIEDHLPDGQSLTESKRSNRTERVDSEDLNHKEEDRAASGNEVTKEQGEKPAPKEGNKPNQQLPRSWSNLKKVILLRRFIKALEKVRRFNPRGPRYLPMEPDPESEKVHLRHQEMEERKGIEEWMLDHALREVVATLTPARKRKVALLVEAFETVMPSIKN